LARWWADVTEKDNGVELGFFKPQTVYRLAPQGHASAQRTEWLCETGAEWSGTRLIFVPEPRTPGTLVRFTHAGWKSSVRPLRVLHNGLGRIDVPVES
jgi:hypothetical protein